MQITSTLWGMEQYFQYKNKSLFDEIRLPNGVDKQTLVNTILVEAGELEVMYTDGDFLKVAITTWFERKYAMLDRWIKAINIEYKPLENYNRTERWTDTASGTTSNNGTKNSTTNNSGSDSGTNTTEETIDNNYSNEVSTGPQKKIDETQVSAFNDTSYTPSQKDSVEVEARVDSTTVQDNTTTDGTYTKNNSYSNESIVVDTTTDNGTSSNTSEHSGEAYGNIGVTTSQQMLEAEMTLWGKIDIYRDTAEMFVLDFCIMVY